MDINLLGIADTDLDIYNKIMKTYFSKLGQLSTKAQINCLIEFKNINIRNSKNCNVSIINECYEGTENSLNLLLLSIYENRDFISFELMKKIEKGLGVTISEETNVNSDFFKKCNAFSSVSNQIRIGELKIDNCFSDLKNGLEFVFYNTGSANSNCGVMELINSMNNENTEKPYNNNISLSSIFNLNLFNILVIITILFVIFMILYFLYSKINKAKPNVYSYSVYI